jgi:4-hydroxy-3-polyprenylbenzoate decarboxylase
MSGAAIPDLIPGVRAVNAVDAAGVHPLLLAIGSERYTPFEDQKEPKELLTQAFALLGQGQLSLAKYLIIINGDDEPQLDVHNVEAFFEAVLSRVDWRRDLHFLTRTTIDTLDYSGEGLNAGSKLVIAATGIKGQKLARIIPGGLKLPTGFSHPRLGLPGVLVIQGEPWKGEQGHPASDLVAFCRSYTRDDLINNFPLIVIVDDSDFATRTLNNLLWVVFTRSAPASDIEGIDSFIQVKHWGCHGSLVIDARMKDHLAPPLEENPDVEKKVDSLGAPGGPLYGII